MRFANEALTEQEVRWRGGEGKVSRAKRREEKKRKMDLEKKEVSSV